MNSASPGEIWAAQNNKIPTPDEIWAIVERNNEHKRIEEENKQAEKIKRLAEAKKEVICVFRRIIKNELLVFKQDGSNLTKPMLIIDLNCSAEFRSYRDNYGIQDYLNRRYIEIVQIILDEVTPDDSKTRYLASRPRFGVAFNFRIDVKFKVKTEHDTKRQKVEWAESTSEQEEEGDDEN